MYRETYVEIDVNKIENNIKSIIKNYNNYKYYIGVVKGNAYGHGAYITKYMKQYGINYFAVSSLDEALEIRKFVDTPILCLEPIDLEYIDVAINNNITITLSSTKYFEKLKKMDISNLKIHIKLNTGMNRLGINNSDDVRTIYNYLIDNKRLKLEGIYTHFSTTGVQDGEYDNQVEKFRRLTKDIDLTKIDIIHLGRSSSLQLHDKVEEANGIRLGLVMYGIGQTFRNYSGIKGKLRLLKHNYLVKKYSISKTINSTNLSLKIALSLKSKIIEVNEINRNDKVGYGGTYIAKDKEYIGICPIGYADGLSLNLNKARVSINNKKYDIVGIINMGMITIKVDSSVKEGDIVSIYDNNIKEISNLTHSTPYVVMTSINPNIKRIYIKDGIKDKEV